MANISKQKRDRMIEFLETLKKEHTDDESIRAFTEIENHIREKKYGLVWEEHTEHVDEMLVENIPVFYEVEKNKIVEQQGEKYNFLIEGDNLQSLYLLQKTHKGLVDVIYIDPPYNTGNEDFIYNDRYISNEDDYLHSKWLSFMAKRLKLAYNLLSERGLLFISIDDHELANLKLLCDEIFGEDSFISNICVETSNGIFGVKAAHATKTVVKAKDHILFYAKTPEKLSVKPLYSKSKRSFDTHYTLYKDSDIEVPLNEWLSSVEFINERAMTIGINNNVSNLSKLMDLFEDVNDYILENADKIFRVRDYTLNTSKYDDELASGEKILIDGYYVFKDDKGDAYYLYPFEKLVNQTDDYESQKCSSVIVGDLWKGFHDDMGNVGKEGGVKFENGKKPVRLIRNILKLSNIHDAIVLDFFAGSGTTAEAVLDLNEEDNGTRRFILCTDNSVKEKDRIGYFVKKGFMEKAPRKNSAAYPNWEKTYNAFLSSEGYYNLEAQADFRNMGICNKYTYPRIKAVLTGNLEGGGMYSKIRKANLKYFICDWTPRKPDDYLLSNILSLHIKEMIELQNGIEVDNVKNVLILNKDDFRNIVMDDEARERIEHIWVNQNIIFSADELEILKGLDYKYIPKEFFGQELKEAAE